MQKIVITGGLGYIGSELCKLYSGEARFKDITVVDKRFVSERVKQLRDWNIKFVQASILDECAMQTLLADADIVIHLAGITDVAYVKTEANEEQDKEIKITAIDGTRNIIKYIKPSCKIIFPSTHVVYEGFSETKLDISEEETTCPVLAYSSGKVQSEVDLYQSDKNFVILRLASVYGYSTDTMRIGIMPNLFSKITSQNGTIKLFSGGIQMKSLVPIFDVVRCMKFMAENNFNRETYHVSLETTSVKQVAELCKEINPKVTLIQTNDEIPNLGYTISNKKLLSTGFVFRHSLKECLKQMIENWSEKPQTENRFNPNILEFIDRGGKEFIDSRGRILNYELTEPINMIGYIESAKGTVRANHYHPIQEQKCLLIKGQYISVIRDLSVPNAPIETKIINPGDIAIIKPNVAHTMVFTKDSIFLNLVRGEREHENYGITHTLPYILVDEKTRVSLLESYVTACRSCGNEDLQRVISLGNSPLANNLKNTQDEECPMYPLEVNYCKKCHNCQLSVSVAAEKMFDNYLYLSSTAQSFRDHFEEAAKSYIQNFELNSNTLVIDIGSNDGIALKPLRDKGIKVLGIEPAKNVAKIANEKGITTINSYFNDTVAQEIIKTYGKAKVVTASNVFAHSDHLKNIANNVFNILQDDGVFIIEVQYLLDTIKDLTFDNIYHEHVNYWSVLSITNFFKQLGFLPFHVEHINTHGGSIRVYVTKNTNVYSKLFNSHFDTIQQFIDEEIKQGLDKFDIYKLFRNRVESVKSIVQNNFAKLQSQYKTIAAYGSPAKATTSLNYFGIDNNIISYTIEDNELKNNKFIPGINIPIKNKDYINELKPDVIVVLAWNFFDAIIKNNMNLIDSGIKFINIKDLYDPNFSI